MPIEAIVYRVTFGGRQSVILNLAERNFQLGRACPARDKECSNQRELVALQKGLKSLKDVDEARDPELAKFISQISVAELSDIACRCLPDNDAKALRCICTLNGVVVKDRKIGKIPKKTAVLKVQLGTGKKTPVKPPRTPGKAAGPSVPAAQRPAKPARRGPRP